MAVVCDICRKIKTKGPGAKLYTVCFAFSDDNDGRSFSVHFEDAEHSYYPKNKAICGTCLIKLGVDQLLKEDMERQERRKKQKDKEPKMLNQEQFLLEAGK